MSGTAAQGTTEDFLSGKEGTYVLGISAYYHDAAAVLLRNGRIVAAAQEERFTRKKHDPSFPSNAVRYCLSTGGISLREVEGIAFYDKPLLKFERLLETYLSYVPSGLKSFTTAMPVWLKEKLYLKRELRKELGLVSGLQRKEIPPLWFSAHHEAHAASAFYPSPFSNAAVLCLDGVGEWATTTAWMGEANHLQPLWQIDFPHSLGLLYSAFTYHLGFKVNSGEYKVMGLAPYGAPRFAGLILEKLIDLKSDGSFRLDMRYFDYCSGLRMTSPLFADLFGVPTRTSEEEALTQDHMDLAASIQSVINLCVLRLARNLHGETGATNLCMAGGVALNCVANREVMRESGFAHVWIQPAAGDAGGALGAALQAWHGHLGQDRQPTLPDSMEGAFLGPEFSADVIRKTLTGEQAVYHEIEDSKLLEEVVTLLESGAVVGWFQGRMEFGPRALGNRSILGDPRHPGIQRTMNVKIKFRESFRPFAPSVMADRAGEWFRGPLDSPYMLTIADVAEEKRLPSTRPETRGLAMLRETRSVIPAVTHVDGTARLQTVDCQRNPRFYALLEAFERKTGCPILVNTSFNVRGEPIVATPADAFRCFMATNMDCLVAGNFLMKKSEQSVREDYSDYLQNLEPD